MTIRSALVPFALGLSLFAGIAAAQEPAANAEQMFFKAFWLERGENRFAEAAALYAEFLAAAPEHRLAGQAAILRFELLTRQGKTDEAAAFAKEHSKLLGNIAVGAPARGERARTQRGGRRGAADEGAVRGGDEGGQEGGEEGGQQRGEEGAEPPARGQRGAGGQGGRGDAGGAAPAARGADNAARIAEVREQLTAARESGDEAQVAQLERQLQRLERSAQGGTGGPGARGQGGRAGRSRILMSDTKIADMTEDQRKELKDSLDGMDRMMQFLRQRMSEEDVKALEDQVAALKTALQEDQLEAAQQALDKVRAAMPRGRRGGGGGQ